MVVILVANIIKYRPQILNHPSLMFLCLIVDTDRFNLHFPFNNPFDTKYGNPLKMAKSFFFYFFFDSFTDVAIVKSVSII